MLGFAATFPEAEASINALNALSSHPQLDYMEDDGVVRTQKTSGSGRTKDSLSQPEKV
jgi:hypothetical protein